MFQKDLQFVRFFFLRVTRKYNTPVEIVEKCCIGVFFSRGFVCARVQEDEGGPVAVPQRRCQLISKQQRWKRNNYNNNDDELPENGYFFFSTASSSTIARLNYENYFYVPTVFFLYVHRIIIIYKLQPTRLPYYVITF